MTPIKSVHLLNPNTVAETGAAYTGPWNAARKGLVQATIDGAGAVTATVVVQGSNDGAHWTDIGTLSLNGAGGTDTKTQAVDYPWAQLRAVSSALVGVGATVQASLSL